MKIEHSGRSEIFVEKHPPDSCKVPYLSRKAGRKTNGGQKQSLNLREK